MNRSVCNLEKTEYDRPGAVIMTDERENDAEQGAGAKLTAKIDTGREQLVRSVILHAAEKNIYDTGASARSCTRTLNWAKA
ncbi:hypothetical protein [Ruegeria atlantica]|uniref:hypothetical protein n=1 Tax=Ruegeria atlantica TaxID=81569 RepID=UPI0014804DA9|nr:hypothetical protein [Ruegeria atlantica]